MFYLNTSPGMQTHFTLSILLSYYKLIVTNERKIHSIVGNNFSSKPFIFYSLQNSVFYFNKNFNKTKSIYPLPFCSRTKINSLMEIIKKTKQEISHSIGVAGAYTKYVWLVERLKCKRTIKPCILYSKVSSHLTILCASLFLSLYRIYRLQA